LVYPDSSPRRAQSGDRVDGDPDFAPPADSRGVSPLSPLAADHASGDTGLAAQGCGPGDQPEPLRGQVGRAAGWRPSRLLLLHPDAVCLAGPGDLPGGLVGPASAADAGADDAPPPAALGSGDRRPGLALRGDLGNGPPADRALLSPREPGDPAPGRCRVLH